MLHRRRVLKSKKWRFFSFVVSRSKFFTCPACENYVCNTCISNTTKVGTKGFSDRKLKDKISLFHFTFICRRKNRTYLLKMSRLDEKGSHSKRLARFQTESVKYPVEKCIPQLSKPIRIHPTNNGRIHTSIRIDWKRTHRSKRFRPENLTSILRSTFGIYQKAETKSLEKFLPRIVSWPPEVGRIKSFD